MKRILVFLGLIIPALRGIAQSGTPDMPFFISFSGLSDSPSNSVLSGEAEYNRVKQPPPLVPIDSTYTNRLDVFIKLPAPPEEAWILEKEADGSLSPVAPVTNLIEDANYGLYFQQAFSLTTNQIDSLIEGNWYAEVDFGDSNYLGNLAPQYGFANGPKAVMVFPPVIGMNVPIGYTVISPNNRTARFVFDGSHCVDPFYLPMQYFWTGWAGYSGVGDPIFTDTGMKATNVFELGPYFIRLQVNDIIANGQPFYFSLQVITAGQAVDLLISDVQSSGIPEHNKRVLVRVLSTAAALFNHGDMLRGRTELEVYQKLVESLHLDSTLTYNLTQPAQDIIDVFEKELRHGTVDRGQDAYRYSGAIRQ
ncbi:MAG TPA: hypothetical protein VJT54_12555 [Verrucomicrobiae bacterium]|nr:hypothetical protein [Verrucomicrobiae bacterium]